MVPEWFLQQVGLWPLDSMVLMIPPLPLRVDVLRSMSACPERSDHSSTVRPQIVGAGHCSPTPWGLLGSMGARDWEQVLLCPVKWSFSGHWSLCSLPSSEPGAWSHLNGEKVAEEWTRTFWSPQGLCQDEQGPSYPRGKTRHDPKSH